MTPSHAAATRLASLLLTAAAGAAGAIALMPGSSDAMLSRSFESALARRAEVQSVAVVRSPAIPAGDHLWLSRAESSAPFGLGKPVATGDRISIATADGPERVLEVIDVHAIGSGGTRAEASGSSRFELVTAKVVGDAAGRLIRFIVEGDDADAIEGAAKPQRTL